MSFVLTDLYGNRWTVNNDNVEGEISATAANDIKIDLTAKEGFKIVSATITGVKSYPMTVSADGQTATKTFWERERGGTVNVTTEAVTPEPEQGIINQIENTTDNSVWYDDYAQWSVRIKANTGFKFATNAVASYEDENGDYHNDTLTKNGVGSMVSGTIRNVTKTTPIIITGEVVDSTVINVNNQIPNTTATGKITASETAEFEIVCESGYIFANPPKIQYTNYYGYLKTATLTLNEDNTRATGKVTDFDESETEVTATGETVTAGTPELTVINAIGNTTEEHTYDGETATITVTGKYSRYRFINPVVTYTSTDGNEKTTPLTVEIGQYGSTATAVLTDVDPTGEIRLTGLYVYVVHTELSLNNCSATEVIPDFYQQGATVEITLQANENTVFNETPTLTHQNENGYFISFDFTVSADKKTASITYSLPTDYNVGSIDISATAEPVAVIGGNYGSINVYVATIEALEEFATKRFFNATQDATGEISYNPVDLGSYVNKLFRLYCNVPTTSTDVIKCGNYNTGVSVMQPQTDRVTLNFGSVRIPNPNNNGVDYQSEINLFVPFSGFVSIPNDYAGEEIELTADINVITGNGVVRLLHNGVMFQTVNIKPNNAIIYRTAETYLPNIGENEWNEMLYYGVEPFVYCKTFTALNPTGRNNDIARVTIGDTRGFNSFTDVTPITTPEMLASEQRLIYDALQRGIYVN